eukprot:g70308.t1
MRIFLLVNGKKEASPWLPLESCKILETILPLYHNFPGTDPNAKAWGMVSANTVYTYVPASGGLFTTAQSPFNPDAEEKKPTYFSSKEAKKKSRGKKKRASKAAAPAAPAKTPTDDAAPAKTPTDDAAPAKTPPKSHTAQEKEPTEAERAEVQANLAALSSFSKAAASGLLTQDKVVRETSADLVLDEEEDNVMVNDTPSYIFGRWAGEKRGEPGRVSPSDSTGDEQTLTLDLTKAAAAPDSSLVAGTLKSVIMKYGVLGCDSFGFFALLGEQYWKNLGITIGEVWLALQGSPPEKVFSCGPDRHLVESNAKGAYNGFVAKGRAILAAVKPPAVAETDYKKYVLRFIEEADVDPIATASLWKDGVKEGSTAFLTGCVEPLLEQFMFAFRGTWPAGVPLGNILTHRLIQASGEMGQQNEPAAADSVESAESPDKESSTSNRTTSGRNQPTRKVRLGKWKWGILDLRTLPDHTPEDLKGGNYVVQIQAINAGVNGQLACSAGTRFTGLVGSGNPMLRFFGVVTDSRTDPEGYKVAKANAGAYSLDKSKKVYRLTTTQKEEIIKGDRPVHDAGGLINHAAEGCGENIIFDAPQKGEGLFPVAVAVTNLKIGMFPLTDYGPGYWRHHPDGQVPVTLPIGVGKDGKLIRAPVPAPNPAPKTSTPVSAKKVGSVAAKSSGGRGIQNHKPDCVCPPCKNVRKKELAAALYSQEPPCPSSASQNTVKKKKQPPGQPVRKQLIPPGNSESDPEDAEEDDEEEVEGDGSDSEVTVPLEPPKKKVKKQQQKDKGKQAAAGRKGNLRVPRAQLQPQHLHHVTDPAPGCREAALAYEARSHMRMRRLRCSWRCL